MGCSFWESVARRGTEVSSCDARSGGEAAAMQAAAGSMGARTCALGEATRGAGVTDGAGGICASLRMVGMSGERAPTSGESCDDQLGVPGC